MVTKVNIGDRLLNNDPRQKGRSPAFVTGIVQDGPALDMQWATYFTGKRIAKVRFDRITERGEKNANQGWTRIPGEPAL